MLHFSNAQQYWIVLLGSKQDPNGKYNLPIGLKNTFQKSYT